MPAPEPHLMPTPPKICSECGEACIAMCPGCWLFVHQDYGYNGHNCSGKHEEKCKVAKLSRVVEKKKPPAVVIVQPEIVKVSKNGKHSGANGKAKK